ncbi:tape measure protein [Salmonella enterica]|nr:tape measure protein [Salmonella enterica]
MSGGNVELQLKIQADLKQAKKAVDDLDGSLGNLARDGKSVSSSSQSAAAGVDTLSRSASVANATLGKTRAGVESISTQLSRLQTIGGSLAGLAVLKGAASELARVTDEYSNLNARVRLVSTTGEQAATTYRSVSQIASDAGQVVGATTELYTRMARSLKSAGATQTELLGVTETISKTAVVSGATAQEASAGIIQLAQGLASGTFRGEEFNSVAEQMPRLMELLQKSLGKTRGELRQMADTSQLTTEVVFRAIQAGAAEINREFEQMPLTIGRAAVEMSNAWTNWIGGMNDSVGASRAVAGVISGLADNLGVLMAVVTSVAVAVGGRYVAAFVAAQQAVRAQTQDTQKLATAELAQSRAAVAAAEAEMTRAKAAGAMAPGRRAAAENTLTAALVRQTAAEKALAVANKSRLAGAGSAALGVFGGPAGLAITAVTLAVGGLAAAYAAAQEREAQLEQQHKQTIQTLEDQRSKTEQLINAQGRLKESVNTGDALAQQGSNADVLTQDSQKLQSLKKQAADLQAVMSSLSLRPIDNAGQLSALSEKLTSVQKQIDELTPKFDDLTAAQATLSSGLDDRLGRALDSVNDKGETLRQKLDQMFAAGPVQGTSWGAELAAQITQAEGAVTTLTGDADKLKNKLEKELANATFTAAEQLEQLKNKVIAAALAAGKAPEDIDKLTVSLDQLIDLQKQVDTAQENKRKSAAAASAAKSQAKATDSYVKNLEKQAALVGKSQNQTRQYELAERGLTGALLARAQAALAVIDAEEKKKQADANATRNTQLEIEYLRAVGDVSGAGLKDVRAQAAEMRKEFEASGNTEGLAWLDKLLPAQEAKVRADALKSEIDELAAWRSRREAEIQTQTEVGLISELEGRRQLVDLHGQVASRIDGYLPKMRELAELPGEAGATARTELSELENELLRLRNVTDDLTTAFKSGLQDGIESSLIGLADGTMNLSDAVLNLAKSAVDAMAQIAAQNLGQMAMDGLSSMGSGLMSMFGGGAAEAATETVTDTAADTAGAMQYATAITTASTTGALSLSTSLVTSLTTGTATLATALATAFTTGAATLATAISTATAGSSAASAGGGMLSVMAATGGYISGPGTGTSDSVPARLSNGEYVIKAAQVRRYGVAFMHALNNGRMSAFADGGLVSGPSVSKQAINQAAPEDAASAAATATGAPVAIQQTLVLDPAEVLSGGMNTTAGQRTMITWVKSNKATLKQMLDVQ